MMSTNPYDHTSAAANHPDFIPTEELSDNAPFSAGGNELDTPTGSDPAAKPQLAYEDGSIIASDGGDGNSDEVKELSWFERNFGCLIRTFNYVVPRGGIFSGVLNLASQTFGAGLMSVPSAFNTAGYVMCIIYLLVFTALTIYSLYLLAAVSEKTGLRTFESLARNLFGRGGDIFAALVIWLLCFGGATGFVVAVGDILSVLLQHENVPEYLRGTGGRRCLQAAVWLLFMLPVALPKRVNSLRYVSFIGVAFVVLVVFSVVGHSAANAFDNGLRKDLVLVRSGNSGISGIAIFVFSLVCQGNSFRIYWESNPRTVARQTITATIACVICGILYFLIGFFGYAEFGSAITGNILVLYDPYKEPLFFVCFVGMVIKLVASFGQNMLACRTAFFQVMHWEVDTMPYWKHSIFAVLFAAGTLILGLFVPDINIVFGLAGALCGGFMGYVFPALFVMYAGNWTLKKVGIVHYLSTFFLLIVGVIAIVFGTTSTIYDIILKYG